MNIEEIDDEIEELKMLKLNLSSLVSLFYWGNKFEEVYELEVERNK
jgi:hypothetical protein